MNYFHHIAGLSSDSLLTSGGSSQLPTNHHTPHLVPREGLPYSDGHFTSQRINCVQHDWHVQLF